MAGAEVTYNGISLDYVKTNSLTQEAVRTDDDIDLLYIRNTLNVSGIISSGFNNDDKPGVTLKTIRDTMLVPRQKLFYKQDSETILAVGGHHLTDADADYEIDMKHGPYPTSVTVTEVQGSSKTFFIDFEIVCFTNACDSENPPDILANRWSMSHEIDQDFRSTRTVRGKLTIRSKTQVTNLTADDKRAFCIPRIPKGFRREKTELTLSSDGLNLEYTIVDKETDVGVPDGLTRWEGSYAETIDPGSGSMLTVGEVFVKVYGQRATTKKTLFEVAVKIALSRFNLTADFVQSVAVSEQLHENILDVRIRFLKGAKNLSGEQNIIPFSTTRIGAALNQIVPPDGKVTDPGDRAVYAQRLFVQLVKTNNDNCETPGDVNQSRGSITNTPAGIDVQGITLTKVNTAAPTDGATTNWTDDHKEQPYTDYALQVKYQRTVNRLHLPIASTDGKEETHFCEVGKPITKLIIMVKASRIGSKPKIPEPTDIQKNISGDIKAKLLIFNLMPFAPEAIPNSTVMKYTVYAEYMYGLEKTPADDKTLKIFKRAVEKATDEQATFDGSDQFDKELN